MAEYIILCALLLVGLAGIFGAFPAALDHFFGQVVRILGLPIL